MSKRQLFRIWPAENKIIEWPLSHPSGTKKQRKDDTGLSYPTIHIWWSIDKQTQ